eukprot:8976541-Pyramimonas_sp.AAC.1
MVMMMMRRRRRNRKRRMSQAPSSEPPMQGFVSTEGSAPLVGNRMNNLKRAKPPVSRLERHDSA